MYMLVFTISYLLGSIPSGLIIGKVFYKTDIREHGSGNLGGTNTFRTLGVKAGLIVTSADILKGTLAAALPFILTNVTGTEIDIHPLLAGMFAVVGHMYPIFAGFRGGKAVATSAGVVLFYQPLLFVILILSFFISLYISKYVSLSSMISAVLAIIYSLFTKDWLLILVVVIFSVFIFYRHRANIKRIKNKTEPKVKWL
ncbi:glycerol-3-phosphate 1-O-acyltransferase PlsY [Fervidibacillus halotolerans]|uniref:Glycerol-3-phosphate acyltransferase n=1 Tax=Fervidibacillus halotolerans TaxID=2980027 RepID=A0A9E8RZK9_9BACI|nr:glycerol-3-phosphate 1-O-acyltransferase PlsY [Fervidibacillus halotolerans]WAA13458.1 glycerol-3-phosphate 1-O-acyltransferase PlsY [Fervidibacillus halotolerans]